MTLYGLLRPLLFRLDPETAHGLVLRLLRFVPGPGAAPPAPQALRARLWGRDFPNPLGLAAGFDKDARVLPALLGMGFGFVEAGTVTPRPQDGNPRPRVFRDAGSESVINRMGFPGRGLAAFERNLRAFRAAHPGCIVGVNIGVNRDAADAVAAYRQGFLALAPLADYVAVNVSSPNTAGLRDMQARDRLDALLGGLRDTGLETPLVLKVAPDLGTAQRAEVAACALAHGLDGLIVSNTTVSRPPGLAAGLRDEKGGLSGRLLEDMSTRAVHEFYALTGGRIPIIGAGGVSCAAGAYAKIRAGASLVQVYTGLVFQGPEIVSRILEGLPALLERDGFADVAVAVGSGHGTAKAVSLSPWPRR